MLGEVKNGIVSTSQYITAITKNTTDNGGKEDAVRAKRRGTMECFSRDHEN